MSVRTTALAALAMGALLAPGAWASESTDAAEPVHLSGFVDASYAGNVDLRDDTFGLDQAEVDLTRAVGKRGALRADLEWVKDGDDWVVSVEQAYMDYTPPVAESFTFTLGRFNAPLGLEGIDPPDMFQFSHSLVYDYGTPTNLTGAMLANKVSERVEARGYLVNGWDNNSADRIGPRTVGGRVAIDLGALGSLGLSAITGRETVSFGGVATRLRRSVLDLDVTFTPVSGLLVGGELNLGAAKYSSTRSKWVGLETMAHFDFTPAVGLTGRFDVFDDRDNFVFDEPQPQTRTEYTLAPTFVLGDGMTALLEARLDRSTDPIFADDKGRPKRSTTSVAFEMTYSF